jgi:hypothetical protein
MEKDDMTWDDVVELFFNVEIWRGMWWCDMFLEFLELFFNRV